MYLRLKTSASQAPVCLPLLSMLPTLRKAHLIFKIKKKNLKKNRMLCVMQTHLEAFFMEVLSRQDASTADSPNKDSPCCLEQ